jgi:hypothetical protein
MSDPRNLIPERVGFSDLAPETLAAILKDCEALSVTIEGEFEPDSEDGDHAWKVRQSGLWGAYPPLTPYLGDDGKVYLREAS